MPNFPIDAVRAAFPALAPPLLRLDNPAGTQVPAMVAEAVAHCLLQTNANLGGYFATSVAADAIVEQAHRDAATQVGATDWREMISGPSMTALTFMLSRSIGATLSPGDEIIVTSMDHDGNVAPWLAMAADRVGIVHTLPFDRETWRIEPEALAALLTPRTKLLALAYSSNLTGSINDAAALAALARQAGALVFIDAVQFAPHGLLDVATLGADFVVASAYKFFGPHLGVLWGRTDLLRTLPAYKVRPLGDDLPWRWEHGTPQIELQAGLSAAVNYLDWLGAQVSDAATPRGRLAAAWAAATEWEMRLAATLIEGLQRLPGITIHGITNPNRIAFRVPTVSFTHQTVPPAHIPRALAGAGICVWSGNHYALEVVRHLGIDESSGVLRIGLAHYNTPAEVTQVLAAVEAALG